MRCLSLVAIPPGRTFKRCDGFQSFPQGTGKSSGKLAHAGRYSAPEILAPHLAAFESHRGNSMAICCSPLFPMLPGSIQKKDIRLSRLAKVIAECSTVHAAATAIMQIEPWDFMAVYYDAIDHFSHGFMRYHPPRLDWFSRRFPGIPGCRCRAYRFHDMMLGTLLTLAGEETTVLLISDHGFHSDHLRPRVLPNEPAGPAAEHRPLGIFVMRGPGIKLDERIHGAALLDVCPTILHLFELPVRKDMDGRVLNSAFEQPSQVKFVESGIKGRILGKHPRISNRSD